MLYISMEKLFLLFISIYQSNIYFISLYLIVLIYK